MDIGHITQLAQDQLGNQARPAYHQDLTGPTSQNHLKVDELGAGDFIFVDSGVAGSNPQHSYETDGLLLSVDRPLEAAVNMGSWGAAGMQTVAVPATFMLFAVFERPSRVSLGTAPPAGVYAPSLLINRGTTTLMGVTSQFRPEGVRLNLPGTGVTPNRPPIPQSLVDKILDPEHPSSISLALTVSRTAASGSGKGFLFVGNEEADSFPFNFADFTMATPIVDIRAGIGTASGQEYRASVYLLTFQIWLP